MINERSGIKKDREHKKNERLKRLLNIDFCACGVSNNLKCKGICREKHTNSNTGQVECGELYQIQQSDVKQSGSRRPKRDWKFGRQKEAKDNKQDKQDRRDKMHRDKS